MILDRTHSGLLAKVDKALVAPPDWVKEKVIHVRKMLNDIPKEPNDPEYILTSYPGNVKLECECTKDGYKFTLLLRPESALRRNSKLSGDRVLQISPSTSASSSSSELYPFAEGDSLRVQSRKKHLFREPATRDDSMIETDDDKNIGNLIHFGM